MLVMSKLNTDEENEMFENMSKELKLILGGGPGSCINKSSDAIKVEAADIPSDEVLMAHGYVRRGSFKGGRGNFSHRGRKMQNPSTGGKIRSKNEGNNDKPYKRQNRLGTDGKPSKCYYCQSIYH